MKKVISILLLFSCISSFASTKDTTRFVLRYIMFNENFFLEALQQSVESGDFSSLNYCLSDSILIWITTPENITTMFVSRDTAKICLHIIVTDLPATPVLYRADDGINGMVYTMEFKYKDVIAGYVSMYIRSNKIYKIYLH